MPYHRIIAETPARPLSEALNSAVEAAGAADRAWREDDSCAAEDRTHPAWLATEAADLAVEAARTALAASRERRAWILTEEGCQYDTAVASSLDEALEIARAGVDSSNYDHDGTIWIDVSVLCEATEEEDSAVVALDPPEPACERGHDHDWLSPIDIVGGIAENPGVQGHGGGVLIHEACGHCGAHRHVDTWAQRPDTGEEGLRSVRYDAPDEASRAWVAERHAAALIEACCYSVEPAGDGSYATWVDADEHATDEAQEAELEAELAQIRASLPPGWVANWTGRADGDRIHVRIWR